jgi:hypothetical protein
MTIRHVRVITASLLTCGLAAFAPTNGRAQDATALPAEKGEATLVGCFLQENINNHDRYVLVNPTLGSAASVPEARCSANGFNSMVKLERIKKRHLNVVNVGQMIEVTGKLEKWHQGDNDADNIREMHVADVRVVPIVPPRTAEVIFTPVPTPEPPAAAPAPAPTITPAPEPAPTGTTGVIEKKHKRLPKSASSMPLIGLLGLVALGSGLTMLAERRRWV